MPRTRAILISTAFLILGLLTTVALAWLCAIFVSVPGVDYGPGSKSRMVLSPIGQSPYLSAREYVEPPLSPAAKAEQQRLPLGPKIENMGPSVYATTWSRFGSVYINSGTTLDLLPRHSGFRPMSQVVPTEMRSHAVPWLTGDAAFPGADPDRQIGARGWPMLALWCAFHPAIRKTTIPPPFGVPTGFGAFVGEPIGGIEFPWPHVNSDWHIPPPPLTALPYRPLWCGLIIDTLFFATLWWLALFAITRTRRALRRRRGLCPRCNYDLRATPQLQPCPECGHSRPTA